MNQIKAIIFDWGDTVMRDFPEFSGPMAYWPRLEVIDDIENALKSIPENIIRCLASNAGNSDASQMEQAVSRVYLNKYFDCYFTSTELKTKKPDTGFYLAILLKLKLEASDCAAVGNDYFNDIVPAKAIGMKTVLFSPRHVPVLIPCADFVISSMKQLPSVISQFHV